jgi:hypothetical protein
LIRAACLSAAAQASDAIVAVTVSHRTDWLTALERETLLDLARHLALRLALDIEAEESGRNLVVRVSRQVPGAACPGEPFGQRVRALWHRYTWARRE